MKKQAGFTLVEIAIVLVIIGLLLGGVLKGQELINSAKVKNAVNDFTSVSAAIYGYQDRYKALPGDDTGATARWTGVTISSGNGNRLVDAGEAASPTACAFSSTTPAEECVLIWAHLRQAGFITGALNSGQPQNAFAGIVGIQNGADVLQSAAAGSGFAGPIICQSNLPDKAAIAIDNQLDDGNPSTGSVRARLQTGATTPAVLTGAATASYVETGNNFYTLCKAM